jgi:endonuclease/exonuclease/phosphatase (EEP) superfamily protein YafD
LKIIKKYFGESTNIEESFEAHGESKKLILKKQSLKILTWNTNKINSALILNFLQSQTQFFDFIFLQEAIFNDELRSHYTSLDQYRWVMAKNIFLPLKGHHSGTKTGFQFVAEAEKVWHSENREKLSSTPKSGVLTTHLIKDSTESLMTLNIHMLNFVQSSYFIKELEIIEKKVADHNGPLILVGDFNCWSKNKRNYLIDWAQNLALEPVHYNGENKHRWTRLTLDYVFLRKLKPINAYVEYKLKLSDHLPMIAEIQLV